MLISIISSFWRYSVDSQIYGVPEEKKYVRLIYPFIVLRQTLTIEVQLTEHCILHFELSYTASCWCEDYVKHACSSLN